MRLRYRIAMGFAGAAVLGGSLVTVGFSDRSVELRLAALFAQFIEAPCRFESAHFSLLHGLQVEGLVVLDPADPLGPEVLRVETVQVDYAGDLLGAGPRITGLVLVNPEIRVARRADGSFALADMLRIPVPPPDEPAARVHVPRIEIRGARVVYLDPTLFTDGAPVAVHVDQGWVTPPQDDVASVVVQGRTDLLGPVRFTASFDTRERIALRDVDLRLPSVELSREVAARIAGATGEALRQLEPSGSASLELRAARDGEGGYRPAGRVRLADVSFQVTLPEVVEAVDPPKPIVVTGGRGTLVVDGYRVSTDDLAAELLGARLDLKGAYEESPDDPAGRRLDATLKITDLSTGERLRACMPRSVLEVLDAYTADVTVDVVATAAGPLDGVDPRIVATLRGGSASYAGYVHEDGKRYGFPWRVDDPRGTVSLEAGRYDIDIAGTHGDARITIRGTVEELSPERARNDLVVTATDVPLDDDIRAGFGDRSSKNWDSRRMAGVAAEVVVHVTTDPEIDGKDAQTEVTAWFDGRATMHPDELPTPMTVVSGSFAILRPVVEGTRADRVVFDRLRVLGEGFEILVSGDTQQSHRGLDERLVLTGTSRDLGGALRQGLLGSVRVPDEVKRHVAEMSPRGAAEFEVVLAATPQARDDRVRIDAGGVAVDGFAGIPMPVEDAHGTVRIVGPRVELDAVTGRVLGAEVKATGWLGATGDEVELDVHAASLPLDERLRTLLGALAERAAPFFDQLRPGLGAVGTVHLGLSPQEGGAPPISVEMDLSGPVRPLGLVLQAKRAHLNFDGRTVNADLDGEIGTGVLSISSCAVDVDTGDADLRISGRGFSFPEDLEGLLSSESVAAVDEQAGGRLLHLPDLHVRHDGATDATTLDGTLTLRPRTRVPGTGVGLAPDGVLHLQGLVLREREPGTTGFAGRVQIEDMSLDAGVEVRGLSGPADVIGAFPPGGAELDADFAGAAFSVLERSFTDASLKMGLRGGHLKIREFDAAFHGGRITGDVAAGSEKLAFRGALRIEGAEAGQVLGTEPPESMTGKLSAWVDFRNPTGLPGGLRGAGRVDIEEGNLGRVPLLGAVAAVAGVLDLDPGAEPPRWETAGADFELIGRDMELSGVTIEAPGWARIRDGEVRLGLEDGRVDGYLDVHVITKLKLPVVNVELPLIGSVIGELQRAFFRARIAGTLRNPKVEAQLVPWLTELFRSEDRRGPEPRPSGDFLPFGNDPW